MKNTIKRPKKWLEENLLKQPIVLDINTFSDVELIEIMDLYYDYINEEITTKEQAEKLIEKLKNFNEPLQFGRWIKDDNVPKWLAFYDKENSLIYGVSIIGKWFKNDIVNLNPNEDSSNRYATDQEILDGLSKMALKLGYDGPFSYDFKNIEFNEWMKNKTILKDGVWLSNEPTTLESLEKRIAALESKLK